MVGLGYVGLPLAIAFAEKGLSVVGFDISQEKIEAYKEGIDVTHEVGSDRLKKASTLFFTHDPIDLKKAKFFIISVPTPVLANNLPDLSLVEKASRLVGSYMPKGAIVVFESTVYPGVTEGICLPLLESASGLKAGRDFKIGYSPERINPGDKSHRLENIIKITSGMDEESATIIGNLYEKIIIAGVHRAPSIKVAEAAKAIENAQRDINIAFINELSLIFDRLDIDTLEVLEAAETKWNFLKFYPGLVGGHCIGVDPYYLAHLAQTVGHHAEVILAGRRINDSMGKYIVEKTIKKITEKDIPLKGAKVLVMGLTFKENCPDLRNSKVADIVKELKDYGIKVVVTDPLASSKEAEEEYNIHLEQEEAVKEVDVIILAVAHKAYKEKKTTEFLQFYKHSHNKPLMLDLKGVLRDSESAFDYWSL